MTNVDTPDHQQGLVNAQKLLATIPRTERTVSVAPPPNTETLVVIVEATLGQNITLEVRGNQTGVVYPPAPYLYETGGKSWQIAWIDVTSVLDREVSVGLSDFPSGSWYVYSDAGVHTIIDAVLSRAVGATFGPLPSSAVQVAGSDGVNLRPLSLDQYGKQWVRQLAPGTKRADHPEPELQWVSTIATANGTVLAAPGAGQRRRVFTAQLASLKSGSTGNLYDAVAIKTICFGPADGGTTIAFLPSGLALSTNAGISVNVSAAGEVGVVIAYTTEEE